MLINLSFKKRTRIGIPHILWQTVPQTTSVESKIFLTRALDFYFYISYKT